MQVIVIMIMLVASFLRPPDLVQQPQPIQLGNPITRRQVSDLPRTDSPPPITLQRALRIAEGFIKKRKVDISTCYLFEAKLISEERDEESKWRFWWVSVGRNSASSKDVRIAVQMDGKVQLE